MTYPVALAITFISALTAATFLKLAKKDKDPMPLVLGLAFGVMFVFFGGILVTTLFAK